MRAQYLIVPDFLPSEEAKWLLGYAIGKELSFVDSTTATNKAEYRKSRVLHNCQPYDRLITDLVREQVPDVCDQLGVDPFKPTEIECQLSWHGDGCYYRSHNDNGSPEVASRTLSYVYYFYNEPKEFDGGELRLYDYELQNNEYVQGKYNVTISPKNNSVIFFPSFLIHEVLPVTLLSGIFGDGRFTLNGWVRK